MKEILDLIPRVSEVCPTCPEPTAVRHLRDAAREFCRRTRIWRATESWELGSETYEVIAVDQEAEIFEISHAELDGRDLTPRTIDDLDEHENGWRTREGQAEWLTQVSPNTLRVVPKPAIDAETPQTLTLELILLPSQTTERLPDILVDAYPQEVVDGALARLLSLKADFQDLQTASIHSAAFQAALNRWGNLVPRGQMRAKRRVRPAVNF